MNFSYAHLARSPSNCTLRTIIKVELHACEVHNNLKQKTLNLFLFKWNSPRVQRQFQKRERKRNMRDIQCVSSWAQSALKCASHSPFSSPWSTRSPQSRRQLALTRFTLERSAAVFKNICRLRARGAWSHQWAANGNGVNRNSAPDFGSDLAASGIYRRDEYTGVKMCMTGS